jgi:hypothetical protein
MHHNGMDADIQYALAQELPRDTAGRAIMGDQVSIVEGAETMLYFFMKNNGAELRASGSYNDMRFVLTELQRFLGGFMKAFGPDIPG